MSYFSRLGSREDVWRHEYANTYTMPIVPAPGLARYFNAIKSFMRVGEPDWRLRYSVQRCGIVGSILATGNWDTGAYTIIDGFRRIFIGMQLDREVSVRIYNEQHLNEPADILRFRLSMNTSSSSFAALSEALAIHSVWTTVVLGDSPISPPAERRILEAAAKSPTSTTPAVKATDHLLRVAGVDHGRFAYTLHPLVHYPHELQCDMFMGRLTPSLAKVIVAGSNDHIRAELRKAALNLASRRHLEELKNRLERDHASGHKHTSITEVAPSEVDNCQPAQDEQ